MATLQITATAASIGKLQDVIALDGKFYGRGNDDNIYRSDDLGLSWVRINATDAFFPYALRYFEGFPYILETGLSELYRDDASTFGADPEAAYVSTEATPFSLITAALAYDGTKLVAIARIGDDYATTLNAAAWSSTSGDIPAKAWAGLAWSGTEFCALAGGNLIGGGPSFSSTDTVLTSPDASFGSWASGTMPAFAFWSQLARSSTQYCAVADGGEAAVSPDGAAWSSVNMPSEAAAASWGALVPVGEMFVAIPVGESGTSLFVLEDGAWSEFPATDFAIDAVSVARIGDVIIAAGAADTLRIVAQASAPFWTGFINCEETA